LSNANGCLAASAFVSSTSTTVSLALTPTIPASRNLRVLLSDTPAFHAWKNNPIQEP
jgi:hypothetical protein